MGLCVCYNMLGKANSLLKTEGEEAKMDNAQIPDIVKLIDNVHFRVRDDLAETITPKSKMRIAAAAFSIYAYRELKKQLESCDELRFLFTSPTFVADKTPKER